MEDKILTAETSEDVVENGDITSENTEDVAEPTVESNTEESTPTDEGKSETDSEEAKAIQKLVQDAETNAKFARERREAETQARIEKALQEQRVKDVIRYIGKNPYTNAEIKDENDVKIYEAMKEAEDKGLDPVAEQYNIIKSVLGNSKQPEVQTENKGNKNEDAEIQKNFDNFVKQHPELKQKDLQELFNNPDWKEFATERIAKNELSVIFDLWSKTDYGARYLTAKKTARENANKKSAPQSASGQSTNYTREQRYDMISKKLADNTMSLEEAEDAWFKK